MRSHPLLAFLVLASLTAQGAAAASASPNFSVAQVLTYPFVSGLVAAERADAIAWVSDVEGVRNVWVARGPRFVPREVTHYTEDDGQEITQLTFSPDGARLLFVRGGDHDANWPAEGNLAPDPTSSPVQPVVTIWSAALAGGAPRKIAEGDAPQISARGELAYVKDDHVWTAPLSGAGKPQRLFFDRGKDSELAWSPDGARLAFVSDRGDHAFIGVYVSRARPLVYLAPSTGRDDSPRWSPDGERIAFVRLPGAGGPPEPILTQIPHPWSIWVASPVDGTGHRVWQSPDTLAGSFPDDEGGAQLDWARGDRLVFLAYLDDWPHLYSLPASGGRATLLTPGAFMVEHVALSRDRAFLIFDANTGGSPGDGDRRHLLRVSVDRADARELTSGSSLEWTPVAASRDRVAFVTAGAREPPSVGIVATDGTRRAAIAVAPLRADFPLAALVTPRPVTFRAADGMLVHGQLFERAGAAFTGAARAMPGVVFVHGGPPRQMLLGWHYMAYYSNAYAVNQYLATHGFVVLSVNYRLGIGYGRKFHQPAGAGPAGASEYQDVLAGARLLQTLPEVDRTRIGIWGGSYGGYLTALALARNSDVFKAGVDMHGVHDWSRLLDAWVGWKTETRYERGDHDEAVKVAWSASPDAYVGRWRSPVLLIQGDDDRNVPFAQTVDLARRLELRHVPFEELVIPNEIHEFLRHATWERVDQATVEFLARQLMARPAAPAAPAAALAPQRARH
ncbi:MAG TPA: prolyl oligopeptidase family serine peptidase [Steroidobacteraceae bacterium]|nr:prolyl oligopeptidase family serine peptidase [Steroidobacteraceae bacterium]